LSESELRSLKGPCRSRRARPLDRQLLLASRERTLNALRDKGYPYSVVTLDEEDMAPRQKKVVLSADPGILAHFGPVEIVGEKTVGEHVVARQLTFKSGDLFTRKEMRESQRKLYGLELFEFVNVEGQEAQAQQGTGSAGARHRWLKANTRR
jgi:outer membrane protein assembly factor BamA